MKKKILVVGLLLTVISSIAIYLFFGLDPSGKNYVGTYIIDKESSSDSAYKVTLTINSDGTGESFLTSRFLPYKGKFKWEHSYVDGYSFLKCTWENPIAEYNEEVNLNLEYENQMTFTLTGLGKFKDSKPGILLTPFMSNEGPAIGEVGKKATDETYNFNQL